MMLLSATLVSGFAPAPVPCEPVCDWATHDYQLVGKEMANAPSPAGECVKTVTEYIHTKVNTGEWRKDLDAMWTSKLVLGAPVPKERNEGRGSTLWVAGAALFAIGIAAVAALSR